MEWSKFDLHIESAGETVLRLRSHDRSYEAALCTGAIPQDLVDLVDSCIHDVESALWAIAASVRPSSVVARDPKEDWREHLLGQAISESLRGAIETALMVGDADGWLDLLQGVLSKRVPLNLRRASAAVRFSAGPDGVPTLAALDSRGESIPMLAPLHISETSSLDGACTGYYLAAFPDAREAVSFLDRCVRGTAQLGRAIKKATLRLSD